MGTGRVKLPVGFTSGDTSSNGLLRFLFSFQCSLFLREWYIIPHCASVLSNGFRSIYNNLGNKSLLGFLDLFSLVSAFLVVWNGSYKFQRSQ
jgi:hypothetical protein